MTINITGIYVDEPAAQKPNPIDQFWTAASDVLIEIAKRQPHIQQVIGPVIAAGGEIEITAHNQAGRISVVLAGPSGLRHVVTPMRGSCYYSLGSKGAACRDEAVKHPARQAHHASTESKGD